jgi:hypothetical protein
MTHLLSYYSPIINLLIIPLNYPTASSHSSSYKRRKEARGGGDHSHGGGGHTSLFHKHSLKSHPFTHSYTWEDSSTPFHHSSCYIIRNTTLCVENSPTSMYKDTYKIHSGVRLGTAQKGPWFSFRFPRQNHRAHIILASFIERCILQLKVVLDLLGPENPKTINYYYYYYYYILTLHFA